MKTILVLAGLPESPYTLIKSLYFQISNWDSLYDNFSTLSKKYESELLALLKDDSLVQLLKKEWGFQYGESNYKIQQDFDTAVYIAIRELQKKAAALGANAIILLEQDAKTDKNHSDYFYIQMYGTAVTIK